MARSRVVALLAGVFALVVASGLALVATGPAGAEPEIQDVQARVDRLFREAEVASERVNDSRLELASLRRELGGLRADEARSDPALDRLRVAVRDAVVDGATSGLGTGTRFATAADPSAVLSDLSALAALRGIQDDALGDYLASAEAHRLRRTAIDRRLAAVSALEERLSGEKRSVDAKLHAAQTLLEELKAEERAEILSRGGVRAPSDVPATGRAAAAIGYAMAQVGKGYVYGAAGPSAFDCSGLTMMAWGQAGVGLPHSSAAQSGMGRRVSPDELAPGDLVFYYSPISHVAMYIGNGLIVHAANPGAGVRVSELYSMPYAGAVRPG